MRIIVPLDAESEDALLRGEGGLDPEWYLETYPDVARAGMDPYFHYLVHGWREGRDPRPDFLTRFYLMTNPDVARLHINPLVHYLAYGKREGRLPAPEPRSASGDDIVVLNGVEILIDPTVMSEHMQWAIQYGQLSMPEASLIGRIVEQGDRFIELGAGIGYTSAVVALQGKAETITVVEANPQLIPTIRRTHARNGVSATVLNAVVLPEKTAETVPFYVHEHFSTSSLVEPADGYERIVDVPVVLFEELARELRPTFLMIDIEGAEIDLFSGLDMAGINKVLIELHKEATGLAGIRQVFGFFAETGFGYDPDHSFGNVVLFRRPA